MAFPTTSVLDNFNRANENPLANGTWSTGGAGCKIVSQVVVGAAALGETSVWSVKKYGPDCEVYGTITTKAVLTGDTAGFCLRSTVDGSWNITGGYEVAYSENTVGTDNIYIYDMATFSSIASVAQEVSAGKILGMQAIGNILTVYYDGAVILTHDITGDATKYTSSGYLGVVIYYTTTSPAIDNFGGGDISSGIMTTRTNWWGDL